MQASASATEITSLLRSESRQNLSEGAVRVSTVMGRRYLWVIASNTFNGACIVYFVAESIFSNDTNKTPLCQVGIGACTLNLLNANLTLLDKKKLKEAEQKFTRACYKTFKTMNEMGATFILPVYEGLFNVRRNVSSEEAGQILDFSRRFIVGYFLMRDVWNLVSRPIKFIMPNVRLTENRTIRNHKCSFGYNNHRAQFAVHIFRTILGVGLAVIPIFKPDNPEGLNQFLRSWGLFEAFHIVGHFSTAALVKLWTHFEEKYRNHPILSAIGLDGRQSKRDITFIRGAAKSTLELTISAACVAFLFFEGAPGLYAYLGAGKAAIDYCFSQDFECATKIDFKNRLKTLLADPDNEECTELSKKALTYQRLKHGFFWLASAWLVYGIIDSETEKDVTNVSILLGTMLFTYFFKGLVDSLFKAEESGRLLGQGFYSFSSDLGFAIYFQIFNQFVGVLNNEDLDNATGFNYIAGAAAAAFYSMYYVSNFMGAASFEMPSGRIPYGALIALFQELYVDSINLLNNEAST